MHSLRTYFTEIVYFYVNVCIYFIQSKWLIVQNTSYTEQVFIISADVSWIFKLFKLRTSNNIQLCPAL